MLLTKSHAELDALRALPGGVITVLKATGAEPVADLTAAAGAPTSDVP